MQIGGNNTLSFGRAFTKKEKEEYKKIISEARNELGVKNTSMVCFDVSVPSVKGENTGIGSSFSKNAVEFYKFMSAMTGMNTIQLGPQGIITQGNLSPFSGSAFAVGDHIIDLKRLTSNEYENILSPKDYKKAILKGDNAKKAESRTDFEHVFNTKKQILKTAFENFEKLNNDLVLKAEFNEFVQTNTKKGNDWLKRDCLYEVLGKEHGSDYWKSWDNELDKNLFSKKADQNKTKERILELENKYTEDIKFHEFCQFIADKQQKTAREELGNIKIAGDCLIGFSPRESWAFQSAFKPDSFYGCQGDDGPINWGLPALDFEKIGDVENPGEAGVLLRKKFDLFFSKYDGARIDAAWQLIKPYLCSEDGDVNNQTYMGTKLLEFMDESVKRIQGDNYDSEKINLEMLGGSVDYKDPIMAGRTQIQHSVYQHDSWGSVEFYKKEGLKEENFIFGLGTHDDAPLEEIADTKMEEQKSTLQRHLNLEIKDKFDFMKAKFSELFTTKNNFFTVFDAMGFKSKFNDQKFNPENWRARIPSNYEETFFSQLSKGYGLNTADALLKAMNAKGINKKNLVNKLKKAVQILQEKGPMTQKTANQQLGEDFSAFK